MPDKVIIIGIGFASRLGLIRAVAQTGAEIEVIVVGHEKPIPIDCHSKYVERVYYCKGNNKDRLLHILTKECLDEKRKAILIPANDFATMVLDTNLELLEKYYYLPHINHQQGAITAWMNKEKQKEAAIESGLNIASSKNVEIRNGLYQLPEDINYPCFTKTREYTRGYKQTLHRCNDEEELRRVLDVLGKKFKDITLMVEDYKEIDSEYAVVGVSDGKEVIIPGVMEILLMGKGNDNGVACRGKIMPLSEFEELIEKFKTLILNVGYIGLFDIDFYLSKGVYYFSEINLRIGGSGCAVLKMGVNLPAMYVNIMLGKSINGMAKMINKIGFFVNERICMDNWYNGFFSTKTFRKILHAGDISFVKDDEDPMPEKYFKRELKYMRIKRVIKLVVKKIK